MDEQKFREWIDTVSNVLKVFVAAKNDQWRTFVNELNKSDKEYISKQLEEYKSKKDSDKKVNGIRVKILEKLSEWSITFEEVDELFKKWKAEDWYGNRWTFWILYSLYYNRYKPEIVSFMEEIKKDFRSDLWTDIIHIWYNHFDWGQNQWKERIYICAMNKCWVPIIEAEKDRSNKKEILKKLKQFRIETIWDSIFRVWLYVNDEFIKWEYVDFSSSELTYEKLFNELNKYKDVLINDTLPDVIDYIKQNISKYSDIKEKAEQERKEFNEKFPLENLKDLPLEEYNYWMWNSNNWSFTSYLNTDYAIAWWLFSNWQNWLFFKENWEYKLSKNMSDYLKRWNWDIRKAFEIYKEDLYNFVKNFDINNYDSRQILPWANYIKAALILLYKWDIFVTLWLKETCYAIANALNVLPEWKNKNLRNVDFIEYNKVISDYLEQEIPDIINQYWYSAIWKCLDKYYETFLMKRSKNDDLKVNYYAVWADLWYWDKQSEFYNKWKLIIWWYEIWDLKQFDTDEKLLQRYKDLKYHDTESHFKQTFDQFKKINKWDIVCVKSVHLQKKEMYIYAVWKVLEWYDEWYEYLDWLWHSLPVERKIIDPKYVVNWAKYQKTLTKINDEEVKKLLDKLLWNDSFNIDNPLHSNSSTMIDLNTILYWVPWTGKTYNTVNYAVSIIEDKSVEEVQAESIANREAVKNRYEEYLKKWQIVFTTFHQSYWYEDFIEWIKASVEWDNVKYSVEPWCFKALCDRARSWEWFEAVYNTFLTDISENEEPFKLKTTTWKFFWVLVNSKNNLSLFTWKDLKPNWVITKDNLQKWFNGDDSFVIWWESYYRGLIDYFKTKYKLKAEVDNNTKYVFIIDEINRWNISKIFWELITLLEPDKRIWGKEELKVTLPYSNQKWFWIPNNIYVLWTMNTADRSIALMDLALRRRFKFREIEPNPELLNWITIEWINVKELFETLNKRIEFLYDRDHLLGHAYFLPLKKEPTLEKLNSIMLDNIVPLLQEYFHDDWEKIQLVLWEWIVKSEMMSAKGLWINNSEYEDYPKYVINTHLSAQDYSY